MGKFHRFRLDPLAVVSLAAGNVVRRTCAAIDWGRGKTNPALMGLRSSTQVAPHKVGSDQSPAEAIRNAGSRLEIGGSIGGPGRTRAATAFPLLRSGHPHPWVLSHVPHRQRRRHLRRARTDTTTWALASSSMSSLCASSQSRRACAVWAVKVGALCLAVALADAF